MIPVVLPGLPPPDTNLHSRTILGDVDLSLPIVTDYGQVRVTGLKVDGWSGGTESTRDSTPRAYRPGATSSQNPQPKPRILGLSFTLRAQSPAAMREAWDLLNVAASIDDTTLTRDQWGLRRSCTVYRQGDVVETLYRSALYKGWACQLKADDPRKYGEPVALRTGLPRTTGGLVGPLVGPLRSTASTVTGTVSWHNDGTQPSPVRLRIDGPVVAPIVQHRGSGKQLVFASSFALPAGSWLDVDLEHQLVTEAGQVSRSQFVTSRGWFDADEGDNDVIWSAANYDPAAQLTVLTAPAWE